MLGADAAEKALVAAYVVLLPLALRYALRGVDPRADWLAVVAVPFTPHYLFTYGFYNLCLGLGLGLLVVGLALRQRDGWTPRTTALLAGLVRERPRGVTRVVTTVAADNRPSLAMLARLGPTTSTSSEDNRVDVRVELPPPTAGTDPDPDPAATSRPR